VFNISILDILLTLVNFVSLKKDRISWISMFSNRMNAALFAIAVASSLVVAIGLVGSALPRTRNLKFSDPADTMINPNGEKDSLSEISW
jgi:hypothetical protein